RRRRIRPRVPRGPLGAKALGVAAPRAGAARPGTLVRRCRERARAVAGAGGRGRRSGLGAQGDRAGGPALPSPRSEDAAPEALCAAGAPRFRRGHDRGGVAGRGGMMRRGATALAGSAAIAVAIAAIGTPAAAGPDPWGEDFASAPLPFRALRDLRAKGSSFQVAYQASGLIAPLPALRIGFEGGYLDLRDRLMLRGNVDFTDTVIVVNVGLHHEHNRLFYGGPVLQVRWPGPSLAPYLVA